MKVRKYGLAIGALCALTLTLAACSHDSGHNMSDMEKSAPSIPANAS